jgi:hypothetical protein
MNKLGQYREDERGHYSFNFTDNDGKHLSISFRADYYDIDVVFNEFRNFLIASGHDIEGEIGELFHDNEDYDDEPQIHQDKFTMDHLPNNGWPFGGLTTTDITALQAPQHDWNKLNQYPTMAPLTSQQVQSWSLDTKGIQALTSADIEALTFKAPGTIGGAKVTF